MTHEELNNMRMAAAMCDDYTRWKREIAEIRQLEAQLLRDQKEGLNDVQQD